MTTFKNLDLNPKILSALEKKGYTIPTPIQLQAIPHILNNKDLLGIAQTGTGKTAAFALPILQNLAPKSGTVKRGHVKCLILTPTRELALQVSENIKVYGHDLHLRYMAIFGGVSENPQIRSIGAGMDIIIATPGRLLDLITQGHIKLSQVEILVLDEADRMLDMGFIHDIKKIIAKLPVSRQTIFFSATMSDTITDLANSILKNPVRVEVTPPSTTVERIDQKVFLVAKSNKPALLKHILEQEDAQSVLVFSRTKHGANRIIEFLEKNAIKAVAIHGNKSQTAREAALKDFRSGKSKILIATDIAARGIDIPGISHVINYDIPVDPESYVHRIGRTARAGKSGIAISFCEGSEKAALKAVEKAIRFQIPIDNSHPYHGASGQTTTSSSTSSSASHRTSFGDRKPRSETRNKPRSTERYVSRGNSSSSYQDKSIFGDRTTYIRPSRFDQNDERVERSERGNRSERNPYNQSDNRRRDSSERPRFKRSEESERSSYSQNDDRRRDSSERPRFKRSEGDERKSFGSKGERSFRSNYGNSSKKPRGKSFGFKEAAEGIGKFFGYKKSDERDSSSRDSRDSRSNFGQRDNDRNKKFSAYNPNYAKKRPYGSKPGSGNNKPRYNKT